MCSPPLKVERSESAFRGDYLDKGRECFVKVIINNQSKSLCDG
jgi:hypothetical protein